MPHQCVRCGKFYADGSGEVLKGCTCGAKLFFYVSKEKLDRAEEIAQALTIEDKEHIEREVYDILEQKRNEKVDDIVILDFESIRIKEPGKFELDLVHLFRKDPVVFKVGEGKYVIDLPGVFKKSKR